MENFPRLNGSIISFDLEHFIGICVLVGPQSMEELLPLWRLWFSKLVWHGGNLGSLSLLDKNCWEGMGAIWFLE